MIKKSNKKKTNNQKEVSTKYFFGTTEKCNLFKKIGDHKLYTTKDQTAATKDHHLEGGQFKFQIQVVWRGKGGIRVSLKIWVTLTKKLTDI